jgi:isoaspartyl peptidase/L-asparaginase-like protein (Ntn-hydrolase superfamily)
MGDIKTSNEMTPKEKAKELVDKVIETNGNAFFAKQCALIAVDELIECLESYDNYNATWASQVNYWQEVKQEIEKL